ncbi:hypothetical protein PybrP1_005142 [[Pythium] brassicae (nom. inval.)]|nr:hypothetical protein PybrP1_005142 [[Pythium] brassicae (nom. inval.)]
MKTRQHVVITRKGGAKLPIEWTEEDDALLAGPRRAASHPLASTANALHVRALQDIFPSLERAVLQDVLVAARFQVDVAAAMLSELARDPTEAVQQFIQPSHPRQQAQELDFDMVDADDDEDWSEVSAVALHQPAPAPDAQSWVMLHDEWEVVGLDGEKVQTLAEMLRNAGANEPLLPALRIVESTPRRAPKPKASLAKDPVSASTVACDSAELSVKSFGARKRRFLKSRA